MKDKFLCIGGPSDGEWRDFEMGQTHQTVVMPNKGFQTVDRIPSVDEFSYAKHHYKMMQWSDGSNHHKAWIHSSLQDGDIMGALLAGYRQPKTEEGLPKPAAAAH